MGVAELLFGKLGITKLVIVALIGFFLLPFAPAILLIIFFAVISGVLNSK